MRFLRKLKTNKTYSHTIFRQLVSFALIISILPLVIACITQFWRMKDMMEDEIINSQEQIISQYVTNLEEKLYQFQTRVDLIANSTLVKEALLDEEADPFTRGTRISEEVTKYLMLDQNSEAANYMVYSLNEAQPVYGKNVSMFSVAEREGWYPLIEKWDG